MKLLGLVLVVAVIAIGGWGVSSYNRLVTESEKVDQAWSQVENVYQRRMDLIPNLVETVEGAAEFERGTLAEVTEARAKAGQITLSPELLEDPAKLEAFDAAQGALSSALSRLLVTVERYPELKANQNFLALQDELAGTENRISVERRRFNETVRAYNVITKRFPGSIVASLTGFGDRGYFEARPGAEDAPRVEF